MPRLGTSKKRNRDCLVCGSVTNAAHLGIDVCRSCAVFHRRAKKSGIPFACRTGTSRCATGKGLNCRRCRLHHIDRLRTVSIGSDDRADNVENRTDAPIVVPVTSDEEEDEYEPSSHLQPQTSSAVHIPVSHNSGIVSLPLLSTVKTAYEKLCFARLVGEQFARKEQQSPMQICSTEYPIFPATLATMNQANRILMTCILEFGTNAFPEFSQLSNDEKAGPSLFSKTLNFVQWTIAVKFFYAFRILDNFYRGRKRFADITKRNFAGYTIYLSEDIVDQYFDDCDYENGDLEEAKRVMVNVCRGKAGRDGVLLGMMNPDEHEFRALLVLLFWATNGLGTRDEITRISEYYQQQVSSELHKYYRDVLQLDDYALRLGKLYSALPIFETHKPIKETFEVLRLLDVFSHDCFTYKLAK